MIEKYDLEVFNNLDEISVGLLFFSDLVISILGITKPDNMVFVQLTGLFLLFAGYCLCYAGYFNVKKMTFIGLGMVILRFSYLLIAIIGVIDNNLEFIYLIVGVSDAIMALVLLIPIILTEGTSVRQLWQYSN